MTIHPLSLSQASKLVPTCQMMTLWDGSRLKLKSLPDTLGTNIQSLTRQPHADGTSGQVLLSTKHFRKTQRAHTDLTRQSRQSDGVHDTFCSAATVKIVNNIFSNQFGISGLQETWIASDQLWGAIFMFFSSWFLRFETSPQQHQLCRRMLQHCLTVKVQKCFVDLRNFTKVIGSHLGSSPVENQSIKTACLQSDLIKNT